MMDYKAGPCMVDALQAAFSILRLVIDNSSCGQSQLLKGSVPLMLQISCDIEQSSHDNLSCISQSLSDQASSNDCQDLMHPVMPAQLPHKHENAALCRYNHACIMPGGQGGSPCQRPRSQQSPEGALQILSTLSNAVLLNALY